MTSTPWDALLHRQTEPAPFTRTQEAAADATTSKAGQVRRLLTSGPMSAAGICMEVDIRSTSLVGALMKNDLAMGRIKCVAGVYELSSEYELGLLRRVREAKALLRAHGYQVTKV